MAKIASVEAVMLLHQERVRIGALRALAKPASDPTADGVDYLALAVVRPREGDDDVADVEVFLGMTLEDALGLADAIMAALAEPATVVP
jgi:hypothetical protein